MPTVPATRGVPGRTGQPIARRADWRLIVTLGVTIVAYGQVLGTLFVGDDFAILHLVRQAGGLQHPWTYFRLDFFGYYRPIAFLSQALDWSIWREQPFGFHLTSLALHAANAALVLALGTRLLGRTEGLVAALLFALHPSNHEAVFWMSSRFDLLATFLMLLALLAIATADSRPTMGAPDGTDGEERRSMPAAAVLRDSAAVVCFGLALLSKESAFALPLIVVAYDAFVARRDGWATVRRSVPFVAVVLGYLALRLGAGGPELGRGLEKFAKMLLLGSALAVVVSLAFIGTDRALTRLARRRALAGLAVGLALLALGFSALWPSAAAWTRPKLTFAGFAGFYLLSPIVTLPGHPAPTFDPNTSLYWVAGWLALSGAGVLLATGWRAATGRARAIAGNARLAFLAAFVFAALLPISSMTEGKRYLYLASVGVSLLAAWAIGILRSRRPALAWVLVVGVLGVSAWQIQLKARDWTWAGRMTRDAVRLVRTATGNPCQPYTVLFLTAPVGVRDVYSHFYDYTFEDPATGCRPQSVRSVLRVVGRDVTTTATWTAPRTIVFETRGITDRLVASTDLRHFDLPLVPASRRHLELPVGTLDVTPLDGGQRFELGLSSRVDLRDWRVFYYGAGRVTPLPVLPR